MLTLDAQEFVELLHEIQDAEVRFRGAKGKFAAVQKTSVTEGHLRISKRLEALDLPVSKNTADYLLLNDCDTSEKFHRAVDQISIAIKMELRGRKFYGPLRRYEQYYEQPKLFGESVFNGFPSANNDISEAGSCLALERGTACVMHLMRVVEVGLKSLAGVLGVGDQNDWGSYLREIDKVLDVRVKTAGKRSDDEQFYAEARVTIDGVRVAWRNATMHVESNYSPERAEEILIAVRALMRHFSTRVNEAEAELGRLLG